MKEITVAVIGSGSTYCPELVDGFLKAQDSLKLKKISFMDIDGTFLKGFIEGLTQTLAMLAMALGLLYTTGRLTKLFAFKKRLLGRKEADQ